VSIQAPSTTDTTADTTAGAYGPAGPLAALAAVLAPDRGGWRELGVCAETDPEAFFPDKGGSSRAAKRVCAGCPVRVECLAEALRVDERHGVWGGTSPAERARLRRAQRPAGRAARAGRGAGGGRWAA
jgi:WhiB family redox-sensing transcriptional regulator